MSYRGTPGRVRQALQEHLCTMSEVEAVLADPRLDIRMSGGPSPRSVDSRMQPPRAYAEIAAAELAKAEAALLLPDIEAHQARAAVWAQLALAAAIERGANHTDGTGA